MKRAAICLEEELRRALKLKSFESDHSISHWVNDAFRTSLSEDLEDLSKVEKRAKEKTVSNEDFLKKLKSRDQI